MLYFDNTLKTKKQAEKLQYLLNIQKGKEKQLYFVGQKVKTTDISPINLTGTITDVYTENGFYRYVIDNNDVLRQKDIEKII